VRPSSLPNDFFTKTAKKMSIVSFGEIGPDSIDTISPLLRNVDHGIAVSRAAIAARRTMRPFSVAADDAAAVGYMMPVDLFDEETGKSMHSAVPTILSMCCVDSLRDPMLIEIGRHANNEFIATIPSTGADDMLPGPSACSKRRVPTWIRPVNIQRCISLGFDWMLTGADTEARDQTTVVRQNMALYPRFRSSVLMNAITEDSCAAAYEKYEEISKSANIRFAPSFAQWRDMLCNPRSSSVRGFYNVDSVMLVELVEVTIAADKIARAAEILLYCSRDTEDPVRDGKTILETICSTIPCDYISCYEACSLRPEILMPVMFKQTEGDDVFVVGSKNYISSSATLEDVCIPLY
jgi:hypothetical protein